MDIEPCIEHLEREPLLSTTEGVTGIAVKG